MRLITYQQILRNPSRRWGLSFLFATGVYACIALIVLNGRSTTQTVVAPLTSAVMIDLPPLPTTRVATPEPVFVPAPIPKEVSLEPLIKPLSELPDIKTADAILPSHTKPSTKENSPPKRLKVVLEQSTSEDIDASTKDVPPTTPATTPTLALQPQISAAWQSNLLTHIQRYKRYPRQARRRGQEAVIYMRVTITRNGRVIKHQLEKTSKYKILNREALALITRAQPLPPPPKEIGGETVEILLPVVFSLRR